jgi:hypothetical protein
LNLMPSILGMHIPYISYLMGNGVAIPC